MSVALRLVIKKLSVAFAFMVAGSALSAEFFGLSHNLRSKDKLRCEELLKKHKLNYKLKADSLTEQHSRAVEGLRQVNKASAETSAQETEEVRAFNKKIEEKKHIIAHLKQEIFSLSSQTILFPREKSRLSELTAELMAYQDGLNEMEDIRKAQISAIHSQIIGLQTEPLDQSEKILSLSSELLKLYERGPLLVEDLISQNFLSQYRYHKQLRQNLDSQLSEIRNRKHSLEEEFHLTMEYEPGRKDILFQDIKDQAEGHLKSLLNQKSEETYCLAIIKNHFQKIPRTSIIHFFAEKNYLFSFKFKKNQVGLKFYSGQKISKK